MSSRADPSRRRILLVDDEPDSAGTMALLLRRTGAAVETAQDCRQAIETAATFEPQVVILDIGLPEIDGYETARRMRERFPDRPVTFIALTGWSGEEDARRSRESGFRHHLVKPVDAAALERILADLPAGASLAGDGAGGRVAPAVATPEPAGPLLRLSHDIRTPLNTIAGAAALLLDTPLDAEQRSLVETMRRSSEALRAVLDRLTHGAGGELPSDAAPRPEFPTAALRVLVADDDPISRRLLVRLLADLELTADVTANGREALDAAARTAYDVVFVDAKMPDLDGAQTVREIRRRSLPGRGPWVVTMTASLANSDREALLAAGADASLVKPMTSPAIRTALAALPQAAAGRVAAPPTLDANVFRAARSAPGGPGVVDLLVGLFLADAPVQMVRLRHAAERGDAAAVEEAAHRLRGSSATVGASRLASIAFDAESRAQRGDLTGAASAIESLEGAWLVTRSALERSRRTDG